MRAEVADDIMEPLTRYQSRQVDLLAVSQYGFSSLELMENAGRSAALQLQEIHPAGQPPSAVILCGKGNNGGDGLVMSRYLEEAGFDVQTVVCAAPGHLSADAAANLALPARAGRVLSWLDEEDGPAQLDSLLQTLSAASWYVDALLGSGARGNPRGLVSRAVNWLNQQAGQRVSIDLPSGLDCDTGKVGDPCLRADHTFTCVTTKPGLLVESAAPWVGTLHVLDLGIPDELLTRVRQLGPPETS